MPRRSIAELLLQADSTIEDNVTQNITPADVRDFIKDFLETIKPSYSAVELLTLAQAVTASYAVIAPWATILVPNSAEWVANLSAGTVTRILNGVAGATSRITIDIDVEGPNNGLITFALFKNGGQTPFEMSATTLGASRPISINFAGLTFDTVNTAFDIRAKGDVSTFTFTNGLMLFENVPVASFV